jgi:hypothetical protein
MTSFYCGKLVILFFFLFVFVSKYLKSTRISDPFFFINVWIICNKLCLVHFPVFVWGPSGLLGAGHCCWVVWWLRSLNAAFPCWSCLPYFLEMQKYNICVLVVLFLKWYFWYKHRLIRRFNYFRLMIWGFLWRPSYKTHSYFGCAKSADN